MSGPHLVYVADPMCSWCWGFSPAIAAIEARFGATLPIRLVLGGLRPGTSEPMTDAMKAEIRNHWQHVAEASGQKFDMAFFARKGFVYDTEPASRAVVALRRHGMPTALAGLRRIHAAFYAENRDVTGIDELAAIAMALGLDERDFRAAWASEEVREETQGDFALAQRSGIRGFPTLLASKGKEDGFAIVTQGFRPADSILPALEAWHASVA